MQDTDLDSFGPRETSSGKNPTCCLRLDLIMLMGSRRKPALLIVSSPRDYCLLPLPLWGALPLLIYVEGTGYMTSPSRIRIALLQGVLVLLPLYENIPCAFFINRLTIT